MMAASWPGPAAVWYGRPASIWLVVTESLLMMRLEANGLRGAAVSSGSVSVKVASERSSASSSMMAARSSGALCARGSVGTSARLGNSSDAPRSEEHTSELQSLMRISYAVFCLKKNTTILSIYPSTITAVYLQLHHITLITR